MITIFTIPKAFKGPFAAIQRNAIISWTLLRPKPQIILLGDDDGVAAFAAENELKHIPNIQQNEFGTPLLSDMFSKAEEAAPGSTMAYVNADIILMSNFAEAVAQVSSIDRPFLMVGQRCDLDVEKEILFDKNWEASLRNVLAERGQRHSIMGMDYFVYPQGFWGQMPPLAIGRSRWDQWLIFRAREMGASVINASSRIEIVHQNHDYSHVSGGRVGIDTGPEAKKNLELAGGWDCMFDLRDSTHLLTANGIKRVIASESLELRRQRQDVLDKDAGTVAAMRRWVLKTLWSGREWLPPVLWRRCVARLMK